MEEQVQSEKLRKVIGVQGLTLGIVNLTIGAGIFALPATVATALGTYSFVAYIFCSIMMASIMWSYAYLGSKFQTSGGSYAYVREAFGLLPAYVINILFFFGWTMLSSAALMNLIADTLSFLFPIFSQTIWRAVFFMLLLGITIFINVLGAKQSLIFVKIITIIKLLPLFAIILLGWNHMNWDYLKLDNPPQLKNFADTSLLLFFAFAGFECALGNSGEIKNASKTIPKAILLGGLIVLLLYLSLQIVVQAVLGDAIHQYKDAPLAAVAEQLLGKPGSIMILLATAISCYGNVAADIFGTSRLLFAGSRDKLLPEFLSNVHPEFNTPNTAILTYGVGIMIFSIFGGFKTLAILASASILLIYLSTIMAQLKIQYIEKGVTKSYIHLTINGLIAGIGIFGILWLLFSLSFYEKFATLSFIGIIIIQYFLRDYYRKRKFSKLLN